MNLFMPYEDIQQSVQALDDKRLNKQILECNTILDVAIHDRLGYAKHPVVKHYAKYPRFVAVYMLECCYEYRFRFGRKHNYFDRAMMYKEFLTDHTNSGYLSRYPFCDTFLYAEYPATNPNCIRETNTERVTQLFRDKLNRKWQQDIDNGRPPKWTNCERPDFYWEG